MNVTVFGEPLEIRAWEDVFYVKNPVITMTRPGAPTGLNPNPRPIVGTHHLYIYAPVTATENSPIILNVNNGGWTTNTPTHRITDGAIYNSVTNASAIPGTPTIPATTNSQIAQALSRGYVYVTFNARGSNYLPVGGEYPGKSPSTMTDVKAVIRYLRLNSDLFPGDSNMIVVTGHSGGGVLSSIIAASGDSPDYFAYLYEIGAAGMTSPTTSTISDTVFAAIAYAPVTGMTNADQAYEWFWGAARAEIKARYDAGDPAMQTAWLHTGTNAGINRRDVFGGAEADRLANDGAGNEFWRPRVLESSLALSNDYARVFDALNLRDANGNPLRADDGTFRNAIIALIGAGIERELTHRYPAVGLPAAFNVTPLTADYHWLTVANGKATIDLDEFLIWHASTAPNGMFGSPFSSPRFSFRGTGNTPSFATSEVYLFGPPDQMYSPFTWWSWNNHTIDTPGSAQWWDNMTIEVGQNNTGLTWEQYIQTPDGRRLLQQIKMTDPVPYLVDAANGRSAPYWYVRYGMVDTASSIATQAELYFALLNDPSIAEVDFNIGWLRGHSGYYDSNEAYEWLERVVAAGWPNNDVPFVTRSGGGGCNTGFGIIVFVLLLGLVFVRKRHKIIG
jgi:hypothetical protein